ncbi:tRNA glutamyl-Q(34) synthetase GluQRS [Ktedonosporobacter rubrisoli]|uniref:Glutamyl-Q tRNA(Asp) synthetase n=1 Tax=Ktedonosporobacter rubrisoli TaxID=2509675 RepID=A0A4P6K1A5_KTERU|nr:tRNA glutamyl-Q(34) synthetase GluQRS [Ktedonosporobacter rubrisoli]QBD81859.1 tRNA glutamyl-Q(34) synthetase GluQRS [Ktedonosporobacter rubrisoli]
MSEIVARVQPSLRGRYAPSPTGDLHMGNLRTALLAWLFARKAGGQFVLRIEDLDRPRVRQGSTEHMLEDLHWLGLDWNEGPDCSGPYAPYTQSERLDIYQDYLQRLETAGLIYPCYCSRAEIAQAASAPQQGEEGPRYPGTCRYLTQAQRGEREASGRRPSLRFRIDDEHIVNFTDLLAGPTSQHVQQVVGDFIVRRADGIFAYQFAVVVDDALMHINQVVRGIDLLHSSERQILLYEALGFPVPSFAHVPLVLDKQGKRLAKREQSSGLAPLRAAGTTPQQVVGQLAASCGLVLPGTSISPYELLGRLAPDLYAIMRTKQ